MKATAVHDLPDAAGEPSMYVCCAPALLLGSQLATMRLSTPDELRQRLVAVLDRFVSTARAAGLRDADIAEARYALVAYLDEQVLKSEWVGRPEWMNQPLQLLLYKEYAAGENFYARLRALLGAAGREPALEAYYLCLAMGFRGAAGARDGGSPAELVQTVRERLAAVHPPPAQLGPNARPRDRASAQKQSRLALIAWVAGCAVVAGGFWATLAWSTDRAVKAAIDVPAEEPAAR